MDGQVDCFVLPGHSAENSKLLGSGASGKVVKYQGKAYKIFKKYEYWEGQKKAIQSMHRWPPELKSIFVDAQIVRNIKRSHRHEPTCAVRMPALEKVRRNTPEKAWVVWRGVQQHLTQLEQNKKAYFDVKTGNLLWKDDKREAVLLADLDGVWHGQDEVGSTYGPPNHPGLYPTQNKQKALKLAKQLKPWVLLAVALEMLVGHAEPLTFVEEPSQKKPLQALQSELELLVSRARQKARVARIAEDDIDLMLAVPSQGKNEPADTLLRSLASKKRWGWFGWWWGGC